MIKVTTILFLLILVNPVMSQHTIINFGQENQNTICSDGLIDNSGNSIVLMYNNASGFMISSFDQYYNVNWITTFGIGSGTAGKLIQLTSGDFFGYILQDPNGKGHIFKFDSLGNILWHKILNTTSNISECIELSNGNIAIIAKYGVTPVFCVFNSYGSLLFSKTFAENHTNPSFYDILKTNDGNQLLVGGWRDFNYDQKILITKIDASFNILWQKCFKYNGVINDVRNSIQDGLDNYFIVGGSADTSDVSFNGVDLSIMKFDSIGNFILGKSYGNQFRDIAEDIETGGLAKNGILTIIGQSKPVEICGDNLLVVSINNNLDTLFTKHYGSPGGSGSYFTEIHSKFDSLYLFGSYSIWSNIGTSDGHLIKTDESFDLECEFYRSGLEHSSNIQLTEIFTPFTYTNTNIDLIDYIIVSNSNITVREACTGMNLGQIENQLLDLNLFPNPSNNLITITSESDIISDIRIYNMTGNEIIRKKNISSNSLEVDISQLSNGCYIIEFQIKNNLIRRTIFKN